MMALVFLISLVGVAVALVLPAARDLILLAGPIALASLFLLLRPRQAPSRWDRLGAETSRRAGPRKVRAKGPHVIVDGSNVLFWNGNTPSLDSVKAVLAHLTDQGFTPGVMFDASAGYRIGDHYQDDAELARRLRLPPDRVLVVPKGTVADQVILQAARDLKARVVTNDRYRDWAGEFPEVVTPGFLIRGEVTDGKVWLDLQASARRD